MDHHVDDDRWDYDCPQFVDFTMPLPFNDGADELFESGIIGEGPSTSNHPQKNQVLPFKVSVVPNKNDAVPASSGEGEKKEVETSDKQPEAPKEATEKAPPSNIVTSLEEWGRGKHASSGPDESQRSKKPRRMLSQPKLAEKTAAETSKSTLTRSRSARMKPSSSTSSLSSERSTSSSTSSLSRPLRSRTRTLSQGRPGSAEPGTKAPSSKGPAGASGKSTFKMPTLLKNLGEGAAATKTKKSTEQLELERIEELKKELRHKRQMAQQSFKKAMSSAGPMTAHFHKDPTVPQEFHFQSDKRLKAPGQPDKKGPKSPCDFVKTLRSRTVASPSTSSSAKKLTMPQPFHLHEKPEKAKPSGAKFESMAEKVSAFHKRTPERFHSRGQSGERLRPRAASPPSLTQPHTPQLTARGRNRPTHHMTQQQLEEQEVEDMKHNQFKARPVNSKILTNPHTGVKKVAPKPTTQPEEFALSAPSVKPREHDREEEHFEFRANPLNKKILEGTVGVKPVKAAMPTVPMSPAFALKHRVRLPVEIPEEKAEAVNAARSKPVPHTGIPFLPKLPHQHTVPEPFSVEERSKQMLAQRELKIKQALEEEKRAREFHAQPLPSHDLCGLPEKTPREPTVPEPFQLETDQRGLHYEQELAHKLTEEEEELRKAAQFKAQPNRTIYKEPFVPNKSTKALTEVSDFELNSERRAMQREEFELRKKAREAELEGHRRQREQREREEEEAAVAKLRAEMVHRPNPVRQFNPMVIKPSDKPLTEAESPRFSDRLRSNVRV